MSELVVDADGLARCPWGASSPEYREYHDHEWGRPVADEGRVYEKLCLEGFQSGLSWLTILRKREGFRQAFAAFDPATVATFEEADVVRLLADRAIVRHRGKILATINNARATMRLWERGTSLASTVWAHEPPAGSPPRTLAGLPASTTESKALSTQLRREGFRFVGPTTAYATMQALGVVNDHLEGCHVREVVESARARFTRP
jgi:DNA-3-methyladenine glycosylase I